VYIEVFPHFSTSYVLTLVSASVKAGLPSRLTHLYFRVETRYLRSFGGRNGIERLEAYWDHRMRLMTLRTYYESIERRFQTWCSEFLALNTADVMTSVRTPSHIQHGPHIESGGVGGALESDHVVAEPFC
jgi:hypothetical protein